MVFVFTGQMTGSPRGACSFFNHDDRVVRVMRCAKLSAHLGVQFIQSLNGRLDVPAVYKGLNLLPRANRGAVLLGLEVGLFGKLGGGVWVAFHGQVVQDEGVNVTIAMVRQSA